VSRPMPVGDAIVISPMPLPCGDTVAGLLSKAQGTDNREMMVVIWPNTLSCSTATKGTGAQEFKLDMERDVEGSETGSRLIDEDTVLSSTSTDSLFLAYANTVCRGWRTGDPILLEDHEIGPPPRFNPGHPFAVGEVIMCDIPGHPHGVCYIPGHSHGVPNGLWRGFVLQSKHPRYQICLESGRGCGHPRGNRGFAPAMPLGSLLRIKTTHLQTYAWTPHWNLVPTACT
jgi:hypothetical protein